MIQKIGTPYRHAELEIPPRRRTAKPSVNAPIGESHFPEMILCEGLRQGIIKRFRRVAPARGLC